MYLTITMVMCMLVLPILDGLLDTHMLSMVPISNGATSVLFESIPNYPNPGEWLLSTVFYYIGAIVFDRTLLGDD